MPFYNSIKEEIEGYSMIMPGMHDQYRRDIIEAHQEGQLTYEQEQELFNMVDERLNKYYDWRAANPIPPENEVIINLTEENLNSPTQGGRRRPHAAPHSQPPQ